MAKHEYIVSGLYDGVWRDLEAFPAKAEAKARLMVLRVEEPAYSHHITKRLKRKEVKNG